MGVLDDAIREHLDLKRRRGADPTEIERAEREALGPVRREPSMSATYVDDASAVAPSEPVSGDDARFGDDDFEDGAEVAGESPFDSHAIGDDAPTSFHGEAPDSAPSDGAADGDLEGPGFDQLAATEPAGAAGLEFEPAAPVGLEAEPVFEPVLEPEPKPKRRSLFSRHRSEGGSVRVGEPADDELNPSEAVSPPALRISSEPEPGNTMEYDVEQAFLIEEGGEPTGSDSPADDEDILEETPDFLADTPDHDRLWFEQKPPPDFDFDK